MVTISTIEDFIRVLDENPAWRDAVRSRLLTKELLELPDKFARFVARTEAFMERTEAFMEFADQRFEAVDRRFDKVDRRFDKVDRRFDKVDRRFDRVEQRLGKVESDIQGIRDDIGPLKGAHARNAAIREADLIAESIGFTLVHKLTYDDIGALVRSHDTSGIPKNELISFRRADLIVEAQDAADRRCYLAIEISFTVNGRDTRRAIRNARLLELLTGKTAYAAVAGLRMDARVEQSIADHQVRWHQLEPEALGVE